MSGLLDWNLGTAQAVSIALSWVCICLAGFTIRSARRSRLLAESVLETIRQNQAAAACPYVRTSPEGTSYCALAEAGRDG